MKLEGGERLALKSLLDIQGDSGKNVEDKQVATATNIAVQDVRDWLETLEGKASVQRTRMTNGFSVFVIAKSMPVLRTGGENVQQHAQNANALNLNQA